jgi:hypothetical protein
MGGIELAFTIAWTTTYAVVIWCNKGWLGDQFRRWWGPT